MNELYHIPVLLEPCIEGLNIKPSGTYVDLTFGGGGHGRAILEKLDNGKLIVFDQDNDSWKNRINDKRVVFVRHNFRFIYQFLKYLNSTPVDGILADLGVSSHHLNEPSRGFSFRFDSDLDMRMNKNTSLTAAVVLNTYTDEQLARVFRMYGEVLSTPRLVREIVKFRSEVQFKTTGDLKEVAARVAPQKDTTRFLSQVFQGLRIEVNGEIDALAEMLTATTGLLRVGGRLVVVSYHSLEDRLVKNFIKTGDVHKSEIETDLYGRYSVPFRQVSRGVIVPSNEEISRNPRARSAKLRVAERID